jgi:hypothetical protein
VFTIMVVRPGRESVEITPLATSVRFSTTAVGGFGSCSFSVPGQRMMREVPPLSMIRLHWDGTPLWEGRVEGRRLTLQQDTMMCEFTCYGLFRLLDEQSVKRVWSTRSFSWQGGQGIPQGKSLTGCGTMTFAPATMQVTTGQFDQSDLTRNGVQVGPQGAAANASLWAQMSLAQGVTLTKTLATAKNSVSGGTMVAAAFDSTDGANWNSLYCATPTSEGTAVAMNNTNGTSKLLLGGRFVSGASLVTWENIRCLCSTINEDEGGGFYGGTLLRDLLSLVTGLSIGQIETGSDFVIQELGRALRDTARSVIDEITAFYTREWAVWEDGLFNWKQPNLDEPQWVARLSDVTALDMESTLDVVRKNIYVLYVDAVSGIPSEANVASVDQRNPYVLTGTTKDDVLQAPVIMTSNSAARLAQKVATDKGGFPTIRGRVTFPAMRQIPNMVGGGSLPAMFIRAGSNIMIPELPKDDMLAPGRDGQTLFHVTATEVDMDAGTMTLELDGYALRSDILLARIAAATRVVTG